MELEQTIRDWGTPEWAIPAVTAWIRSGGTIDRDLWIALRAAAREVAQEPSQSTCQNTNAVFDREDAKAFRIVCCLDARTIRMLEDIEKYVSADSGGAPRSAAVRSAIQTLHRALWPIGTSE